MTHHQIIALSTLQSGDVEMHSDLLPSDEALVRQYQRGDPTAFDVLYLKYRGPIYRQILAKVQNQDDAWDIHQETFWKVSQHLPTLCLQGSFKAWLATIARNCSIDHLRKKMRHDEQVQPIDVSLVVLNDPNSLPEIKIVTDEWLREALEKMKPQLRAVLLQEDLS